MRLFASVILVAAACGDDGATTYTGPIEASVTHYDYSFDVDSRAAHAKVTFEVTTPGDCFTLPFRGEAPANVMLGGAAATQVNHDTAAGTLQACVDGGVGEEAIDLELDLVIPLQTISTSQVGYSKTVDSNGNPFYYLVSWVGGCDQFAPCDDRPNVFATYTFTVTHPDTLQVACPGVIATPSATQTTCTFDHPGGPTYSTFGVAAYPKAAWVSTDKGMWGSVHATVYARPQTLVADAIETAHHDAFVRYMEENFGPYPYGTELRVYAAPTYWAGFEHPGSIVLDDSLGRAANKAGRHTLDHEIVHQWAGDETTLADTYDFVWKESMAEYLTFTHEAIVDAPAADRTVAGWKSGSAGAAFFPVPQEKPALFDYYGDAYGPGPMILFRQIERMSSREQVIAALKTLLGEPRAISVDDVVGALETSTGLDLDAYAAAWLRGTGAPTWPRVKTTYTAGSLRVQVTAGGERRCKFGVALVGANPGEREIVDVNTFTGGIDQTITVTPAFTVTSTELDPLRECLVYPDTATTRPARVNPWLSARAREALRLETP
ncbi:MAG: hypothetical protein AB7T06_16950 [Kofleriaceae bacterium]